MAWNWKNGASWDEFVNPRSTSPWAGSVGSDWDMFVQRFANNPNFSQLALPAETNGITPRMQTIIQQLMRGNSRGFAGDFPPVNSPIAMGGGMPTPTVVTPTTAAGLNATTPTMFDSPMLPFQSTPGSGAAAGPRLTPNAPTMPNAPMMFDSPMLPFEATPGSGAVTPRPVTPPMMFDSPMLPFESTPGGGGAAPRSLMVSPSGPYGPFRPPSLAPEAAPDIMGARGLPYNPGSPSSPRLPTTSSDILDPLAAANDDFVKNNQSTWNRPGIDPAHRDWWKPGGGAEQRAASAGANLSDDAANTAGSTAANLSDDVARGGLANYLKNYGSAALTTLNPASYRGGAVPFVNPSAGTFSSWANMASKIPGTGRLTGTIGGLARYGVGSGLAAGVGIPLVTNYLQGDDTGTGMDNVLEAIGAGASGGSAFGPVGSLIGGAGVGIGQGVTELVRGTGLLGEGRKGSFVDIISNTDNPITSTIGGMFGGDEGNKTALKLNPGTASDITTNQVGFTPEDRLNAAFDSLNLDQQSRADLTNKYQTSRAMLQVQYEMDPAGFSAAFEASTGVPFDPANLDQYAMQDIVTSYLPSAVEQQSARLAMLQRAAQYQAMLTPYLQPIQDDYNHLASLTSDPRVASLLSAQGLATERSMRALPQLEAMTAYQSQYNQLAQQQFQDSINPSTTTDPLSAASVLDASLLPTS